jgi:hypothetical protein
MQMITSNNIQCVWYISYQAETYTCLKEYINHIKKLVIKNSKKEIPFVWRNLAATEFLQKKFWIFHHGFMDFDIMINMHFLTYAIYAILWYI